MEEKGVNAVTCKVQEMVRASDGRRRDVSLRMKKEHGRGLSLLGNANGEFYYYSRE